MNNRTYRRWGVALLAAVLLAGVCAGCTAAAAPEAEAQAAASLVEAFGRQLQKVSLLGPEGTAPQQIAEQYAAYLTPALLRQWEENPETALGRSVSSPWPDRIAVTDTKKVSDSEYEVTGDIVWVTSVELASGGATETEPIALRVVREGPEAQWRIDGVSSPSP